MRKTESLRHVGPVRGLINTPIGTDCNLFMPLKNVLKMALNEEHE